MMRSVTIWYFVIGHFCLYSVYGQRLDRTMDRLPDTGQNLSYTNTFGEDHDYTIYPPQLIADKNGTVIDSVTGLMWQAVDGGEMTIENARLYVDTLELGGFLDWRLPDPYEAFSIMNHQMVGPAIDTRYFTNTGAEYWWTKTRQYNDSSRIWVTNSGGGLGNHNKTETISAGGAKKYHVRAVRSVKPDLHVPVQFNELGNGVIRDEITGLSWLKSPLADSMDWETALQSVEALKEGGMDDWRLPNIKELQTVTDFSRSNPSIFPSFLIKVGTTDYWSSTTLPNQKLQAWLLNSRFGIVTYEPKTNKNMVLCVRGPSDLTTSIRDVPKEISKGWVYPNPFTSKLHVKARSSGLFFELRNSLGELIYSGKELEEQDFSQLIHGFYILSIKGENMHVEKLIK